MEIARKTVLFFTFMAMAIEATSPARDDRLAPNKRPRNVEIVARLDYLERGEINDQSSDVPPIIRSHKTDKNLFDVSSEADDPALLSNEKSSWDMWSDWSSCSCSCGGGVCSRTRRCISMLSSSPATSPLCNGSSTQHRLCNNEACPDESPTFREQQCSEQDEKIFHGRTFSWIPFNGKKGNSCDLMCMAENFHFYHSFGTARDGTRCKEGICIRGECATIGCDGVIGSNMTEDVCGVCGGNNGTCFRYQNVVDRVPKEGSLSGYNKIATIPIGATHVQVKDYNKNYLALAEPGSPRPNYIVNGDWLISWTREFQAAGTIVSYMRTSDKESIEIAGPTTKELTILVLGLGQQPPLVQYEYWIPNSVKETDDKYAELKIQRHGVIRVSNEEDYKAQIIAAGLDFDAVVPPTAAPTITTTTLSVTETLQSTTNVLTSTSTVTTRTNRPKSVSRPKTGASRTSDRTPSCTACKKTINKKKLLCDSEFAIHVRILPYRRLQRGRYIRYAVEIFQTYKSKAGMNRREYIWISSSCCQRLRPHRHYFLAGRTVKVPNRTSKTAAYNSRFLVEHVEYWYQWRKYHARMARLARNSNCKRYRHMASRYYRKKLNEG